MQPYFSEHVPRNIYLSLLHLSDNDPTQPKVPDSLIRAALLNRAVEDIDRILHIRTRKQALATLFQKGSVGDDIWQRLLRAEKELEVEVKEVVEEANAFQAGWGQTIFQSAGEMANRQILHRKLTAIQSTLPKEKRNWETRREAVRESFMKELESNPTTEVKKEASDEDAVLVERDGGAAGTSGGGGGKGGKKKRGKK